MPWSSFTDLTLPKESLVGWATGITVNLILWAFIVVPFSYHKMWPISLVASILYSSCLFFFIRRTHKAIEAGTDGDQESIAFEGEGQVEPPSLPEGTTAGSRAPGIEPTRSVDPLASPNGEADVIAYERDASDDRGKYSRSIPFYLSLLYGLFALSVGVPGAIIATKAFPCHYDPNGWYDPSKGDKRKPTWKTDTSLLPEAVQQWDQIHNRSVYFSSSPYAQIDTVEGNVSVYFVAAKPGESKAQLQVMSSGLGPQEIVGFSGPSWLTAVSNQYVCFLEAHGTSYYDTWHPPEYSIACGNEALGFNSTERFHMGIVPTNFAGIEGLLWFQQTYAPGEAGAANGYAIVSMDPAHMDNMTIHSTLEPPEYHDGDGLCVGGQVVLLSIPAATCLLFLSALPMVVLSGWFWYQKSIPSSSLTLSLSLGVLIGCFFVFGDPNTLGIGFMVWMIVTTPIWLFVCSYILAVSPRAARQPLVWFVYAGSSFTAVWTAFAVIGNELSEDYWKYTPKPVVVPVTIFNLLFVFLPLFIYGIILRSTYVISLGGLGTALFLSNATFVLLEAESIPLALFLIIVECLFMFAGTHKVLQTKGHLQKVLVDGLRKFTSYLCARARSDTEMELAESLLLTEETEARADNHATPDTEI